LPAARVPAVDQVLGLDIAAANVAAATENARRNGVESSTRFVVSDSYQPADERGRSLLEALRGNLDFILANPPASDGDDGFGFRRAVMIGARPLLHSGGVVFLSISQQYGPERIASLSKAPFSFRYRGLLESTDWVPFDLRRPDLMENIRGYAKTESEGGMLYQFRDATTGEDIDARTALSRYEDRGIHPLSKWQTHLLEAP
jgi:Methyltransferase small domain